MYNQVDICELLAQMCGIAFFEFTLIVNTMVHVKISKFCDVSIKVCHLLYDHC